MSVSSQDGLVNLIGVSFFSWFIKSEDKRTSLLLLRFLVVISMFCCVTILCASYGWWHCDIVYTTSNLLIPVLISTHLMTHT
jgi:hypothetical protein